MVKENLLRVFMEFHNRGVINQSTNAIFIALVLKRSQTNKISNFRLINLVTCLYKIITKVLSGCIQEGLQEAIHFSQGAFVEEG